VEAISFEDYEAAYNRFVVCLRESGVAITEHGFDLIERRFDFTTEGGVTGGPIPDAACYEREFQDADERWQFMLYEDFRRAAAEQTPESSLPGTARLGEHEADVAAHLRLIAEPWEHPGLEHFDPEDVAFQIFRFTHAGVMTSWTAYRTPAGARMQRLQAPVGLRQLPRELFGSQDALESEFVENILRVFRSAELPTVAVVPDLDVAIYGLRFTSANDDPVDVWWRGNELPSDLTRHTNQIVADIDVALPAYSSLRDRL